MKINDKYMDLVDDFYKKPYLAYKTGNLKLMVGYGSHQLVLIHVLNTIINGNVLEFGMGYNSTPLMHVICEKQNRKLFSIDTDWEWIKKFENYESKKHKIYRMNIESIRYEYMKFAIFQNKYSIVFIDNAPGDLRQPFINLINKNADYIVVHDTEEIALNFKRKNSPYCFNFSKFKHILHFKKVRPSTTILSNLNEIDKNLFILNE